MSVARAIASNTAIQVAGKFAGNVLGILTIAIMTRALGRDGYGAFTTAISFLQFFGILVDFGLTLTMVRMVSEERADVPKVASNIFTLRLASGAVFFGLAPVLALAFPYPPEVKTAIAIGALSFFAMTSSQVLTGIFQKHLATGRAALADVSGRAVLLAGAWLAATRGAGLLAFIAAFVAANLVQLAITFVSARKFAAIGLAFDLSLWRKIVRESWPIGVSIAFNLIYLKGDVIILSLTRSQGEVGLYGASYKVLDVITVIPMIFMGLVLPQLTAAWSAGKKDDFARKLGKAFDAMSVLALPLAFGTFAVASDLMAFVAGPEFAASGPFLAVLMLAGAAVFWSALFGHTVVALGLQRKMIVAYAADAALSLALYVWAVPRFGGLGAAWVTVFSETFIMVVTAWAVIAKTGLKPPGRVFVRCAAASACMAGVVALAAPYHVIVRIIVGAVVYAVLLSAFGVLTRERLSFLRRPNAASGPVLQ
ncbi:MAG TPA: flippase [Candidatus Eisenbacteria bacterium]|nr:flippase [Candidatus Eisenbacteria bacterium]